MTKFSFNQAVPFEATHVGEVIKDELSARDMKQCELSELTGIQKSILNDVIKGKRSLTPEMALLLESALGVSAEFLMNIQTRYELNCAKLKRSSYAFVPQAHEDLFSLQRNR
jgi:HTH-type transcriptional regulator / antitoxin HigA